MIRIFLLSALISSVLTLHAQNQAINTFMDQYEEDEGFFRLDLAGSLINNMKTSGGQNSKLLKKLSRIRILSTEQPATLQRSSLRRLKRQLNDGRYESLLKIREDGDDIDVLIREEDTYITNLVILVSGEDNFTLLSLDGRLSLRDVGDLQLGFEGAEVLNRLDEERPRP